MIEQLVREQYGRSVDLLERGRLTEGVIIPTEAECIDILRDSYTDKQITYVQEKIRRPVFQIVPHKPFADFENALNLNRQPGQLETHLTLYIRERFAKMPSSNEAQIGFVEGMARLPGTPLIQFPLPTQRQLYKKTLPKGVNIIHPRNYSLLQLNGRVDEEHWAVLEDNLEDETYLPGGRWGFDRPYFNEYNLDAIPEYVRWRASVMVSAA
ncbi:MAG: hypothetical protein AAB836_01545 [Patescibacteria group bacterium]